MRANEVVEENEHGNEVIGGFKRVKALLGLVPGLELFVKCLNQIVGDVIFERVDADMGGVEHCLDRLLVSGVAVGNDRMRISEVSDGIKQRESLRRISVTREMKSQDKAGFRVNDEPDIVLDATDLHNSFVGMPFVGVEVKGRYEFKSDVVEQRSKAFAPVVIEGGNMADGLWTKNEW